jgi:hypothetical protein
MSLMMMATMILLMMMTAFFFLFWSHHLFFWFLFFLSVHPDNPVLIKGGWCRHGVMVRQLVISVSRHLVYEDGDGDFVVTNGEQLEQ